MAKDKNKTGRTPQDDAPESDRRSTSDAANEGSGTPKGGASRGGQFSAPDRNSQRIDDDDDDDDMDFRPGRPMGAPRNR